MVHSAVERVGSMSISALKTSFENFVCGVVGDGEKEMETCEGGEKDGE